jgi:murein L,D-transpeptidase YcbB/YkuD
VVKVSKLIWNSAAIAAMMLVPVSANAAMAGSPAAVAASQGIAGAIDNFYRARGNAPLWFEGGRESNAATELVRHLRSSTIDGLSSGPLIADQLEQAIARARSGDPRAIAEAERMMSSALVVYVQTLRAPTPGMIYGDPGIPASAPQASIILRDAAKAQSLGAYLASVSQVNPTYAALKSAALASGEISPIVRANLERARAIPATGRFVLVDAAAARLWMYEDGRPVDSMKVIVGKPEFATPMIASVIHYATVNPYWHVPDHLVRDTVAAGVLKQGLGYLKARGYQVVSEYSDKAAVLPPSIVDWKAVAAGQATAKIRQLPGPMNSMGQVKFSFANGEGIYLHDTPDKTLFAKEQRTLSNGCVRVEDAARLSRWLMGREPSAISAQPEQYVRLPKSVPIYITYLTATPAGGSLAFVYDVYGRDAQLLSKSAGLK